MADFDIVSKYLIQHYPDDVARFALGRDDVEFVEWLDTEQTDFQARRPDSLLRVRLGGETVVVHTEFQNHRQHPSADAEADGRVYLASH